MVQTSIKSVTETSGSVEGNREVTVVFEVRSSARELEEEFIESSIKIWAISNTVEDAASLDL